MSYERTLNRVETYFDKTATRTWERLTSDAPVSKIRETVRKGRDAMRREMLSRLPADLSGARVLDAGCGAGQMTLELASKGADVVAIDISPSLVQIAEERLPDALQNRVTFRSGDMLNPDLGEFDYIIAMDSLIYYTRPVLSQALEDLSDRTHNRIVFTVAPRTPLLMVMWNVGKLFPRSDRSPVMVPHAPGALATELDQSGSLATLKSLNRISSGFYISQAMELVT